MNGQAPQPINPTLATAISAARSIGTILTAIGTIWGFARTQDLTGLYQWVHGSNAAAAGSAALFVLCFGWGLYRKYIDRTVVTAAHVVGVTKANAGDVIASPGGCPPFSAQEPAAGAGLQTPVFPPPSQIDPAAVNHI